MRVKFEMFKSHLQSWDAMFTAAAGFASRLGPDRLISISHSEDQGKGVVTVWYWQGTLPEADRTPLSEIENEIEDQLE